MKSFRCGVYFGYEHLKILQAIFKRNLRRFCSTLLASFRFIFCLAGSVQ